MCPVNCRSSAHVPDTVLLSEEEDTVVPVSEPEPPDRIAATLPPPDSDVSAMSETEVSLEGSEEELVGSRRAMATVSSWATVAEAGGGASGQGGT